MLSLFRRLLARLDRGQRLRLAMVVAMLAVGATLEMVGIGALLPITALMQSPGEVAGNPVLASLSDALGSPSPERLFLLLLGALLAFFLLKNAFLVATDLFQYRLLADLQARVANRLVEGYLQRPYAFFLQSNTAGLIRNVTSEVNSLFYFTLVPLVSLAAELLVMLALFALVLLVDPTTALLLSLAGTLLVLGFFRLLRDRMYHIGRLSQESTGRMIQAAQEGFGGIKELRILGRDRHFAGVFAVHSARNARALRRALVVHNFPARALELIFVAVFVLAMAMLALQGKAAVSLPVLAVYAAAAFRLIPSLNRITTALARLRQGQASLRLLMDELEATPADARTDAAAAACPPLAREIVVDGLGYTYPGAAAPSLGAVSLRIGKGEMVAFVGPSGSGKTTLVDCIVGLLSPDAGTVSVDGFDVARDLAGWRRQIGYIPQHVYLVDDSLRRNVALGLEDARIDDARVLQALAAAQLADFVATLPDGLDTRLGERGARLSGGQQQRIGIARALYHDPQVLVLDEATSALDEETERALVETLAGLKRSRTILVIAHRLSTIRDCDRIHHVADGRLATGGSPRADQPQATG